MRVALVASPFIPVPPKDYGGTELFIADLARGLQALGVDVTVYAKRRVYHRSDKTLAVRELAMAYQRRWLCST